MSASSSNPLRIPHPKIDKLACQAQGVGIFAKGEITLLDAYCTYLIFKCAAMSYGLKRSTHQLYHTISKKSIGKTKFFQKFDLAVWT